MQRALVLAAALSAVATGGCATNEPVVEPVPAPALARTNLLDAYGCQVGTAAVQQVGDSLRVTIDSTGLPGGAHGAHLHQIGLCTPAGFESAGSHWNPTSRQHGKDNPAGLHLGDLPNVLVGTDGRGTLEYTIPMASLGGLLDGDGAAVVVHAQPDDYRTDPSGNSGGRIACGVLA